MKRAWKGSIAFEGVPTSDGRTLVEGRSDWTGRLPRPLMGPSHSDQAQNGWQPVGSVQEVTVSEGVVTASGYFVVDSIPAGEHGVAVFLGDTGMVAPGEMYGTFLALHLLADGVDPAWPAARITIEEADSDDQ